MRRMLLITAAVTAGLVVAISSVTLRPAYADTLFTDTFDDGDTTGWSRSGGSWSVTGEGVLRQTSTSASARARAGDPAWTDYTVQARLQPGGYGTAAGAVTGVAGRVQGGTSYYALTLNRSGTAALQRVSGSSVTVLASAVVSAAPGGWRTLALRLAGSALTGSVDGAAVLRATDTTYRSGRIGLIAAYAAASFDDVTVATADPGPEPSGPPPSSPPPSSYPPGSCRVTGAPAGFAATDAWGQNSTTGGAAGPTVAVDTAAELVEAIGRAGPLTVCVTGPITLPAGMYDVASDKSIVGAAPDAGISGGGLNIGGPVSDATTPPADAVHNVIIQNLTFRDASDDSINVQMFAHHVWVDHNDLAEGYDGLIDIKRGASYVTVSWNHTHDHTKNMLLGHDDGNGAQDTGRLRVTYHHNWFDATPQRNPRVRFGEPVHIYNNYFFRNSDTGVACQNNGGCVVEGNYFENVEEPVTNTYAGPPGRCVTRNNVFAGESGTPECSGSVAEPNTYYPYTLDDPNAVKAIVTAGAGRL